MTNKSTKGAVLTFLRKDIVTPLPINVNVPNGELSLCDLHHSLPENILGVTGSITDIRTSPQQGYCSHVIFLDTKQARYALKYSHHGYRGDELHAEYKALKMLAGTGIPTPAPLAYSANEHGHFLLTSFCPGTPLNGLLVSPSHTETRRHMIQQMAELLSQVHRLEVNDRSWEDCVDAQLCFARKHLEYGNTDPAEFNNGDKNIDPAKLLHQLITTRPPAAGRVCVLHGDFRPKNMLWDNGKLSCLLDWAFCDIGDPYYDLAIFMYYLKTQAEREHFLTSYGLGELDETRLRYFEDLSRFINV